MSTPGRGAVRRGRFTDRTTIAATPRDDWSTSHAATRHVLQRRHRAGRVCVRAAGVNPMITIAALAHYVAQQIKAGL